MSPNAKVFATPTQTDQVIVFVDALLNSPGIAILDKSSTRPVLRQLCLEKNLSAYAIPDGLIAATVMQINEVLATFDRDFFSLLLTQQLQLLVM